jgi:hypothetical protein
MSSERKVFFSIEVQGSLSSSFAKRNQVRLKSLLILSGSHQIHLEPTDVVRARVRPRPTLRVRSLGLNPPTRFAPLLLWPLPVGRFA